MDFKFKNGQKVHVKFTEMFSTGLDGVITDCRVHPDGKNQYKLKDFTGWWDEITLQEVKNED